MCHRLEQPDWVRTSLNPLAEIPQPPTVLYYQGSLPTSDNCLLTVVGSRHYSTYGKRVVNDLIDGLRSYAVGIVSGLAKGIDGLAHEAALDAGLYTMAVPGSGLAQSALYPRRHQGLADRIIKNGGCLLSEFPPHTKAARWTFPQRNRLMAGLASATLLIEASERSGTLITARLAVEYNRELLVVPGDIYAPGSTGVHQFLKLGATPVTSSLDIIDLLDLIRKESPVATDATTLSVSAQQLLTHLTTPIDIDTLITRTNLSSSVITTSLMELELTGHIRQENGLYSRRI